MGFSITEIIFLDAVTVSTGPFTLWIATTNLAVVEAESSEATLFVTFIRSIGALSLSITIVIVVDALSVRASELSLRVAATLSDVVEVETSETTASVTFIRSISALFFAVTESRLSNAVT